MCENCGCGEENQKEHHHEPHHDDHQHTLPDGRIITHSHPEHKTDKGNSEKLVVPMEKTILEENHRIAEANRDFLDKKGVMAINLISSPGSGKTTLLEKTLKEISKRISISVIAGDQKTDNDAKRISKYCDKVLQIETMNACHLNAAQVAEAIKKLVDNNTKLLFIENVGNLVCPAAFDLGENFKAALLSVPEGEDKPLKYPSLFSKAKVVIITKIDLLPHLDFNIAEARKNIRKINPGVFIFELSAKTGEGLNNWINYLLSF
jgi:hydrogenase nickel incorporation protein HypB